MLELGPQLPEHPGREVDAGDVCTFAGHAQRVATGPAADIHDPQLGDRAEQGGDDWLLDGDDRVVVVIVVRRPAVVAFLDREDRQRHRSLV